VIDDKSPIKGKALRVTNLKTGEVHDMSALVELTPPRPQMDWTVVVEGFRAMGEAAAKAMQKFAKMAGRFSQALREAANDEVRVSGQEGRYYVRGASCTTYTDEDIDDLVNGLLDDPVSISGEPFDVFLTPESRSRLAASALRGWVEHHPQAPGPLTWYRLIGGTTIQVGRSHA